MVVNNDGYTVERAIHGKTAPYNDIVSWSWTDIPTALGVANHLAFRAQTYGELDDAFVAAAEHRDRMVLVEVVVPRLEIPHLLGELVGSMSPKRATPLSRPPGGARSSALFDPALDRPGSPGRYAGSGRNRRPLRKPERHPWSSTPRLRRPRPPSGW